MYLVSSMIVIAWMYYPRPYFDRVPSASMWWIGKDNWIKWVEFFLAYKNAFEDAMQKITTKMHYINAFKNACIIIPQPFQYHKAANICKLCTSTNTLVRLLYLRYIHKSCTYYTVLQEWNLSECFEILILFFWINLYNINCTGKIDLCMNFVLIYNIWNHYNKEVCLNSSSRCFLFFGRILFWKL